MHLKGWRFIKPDWRISLLTLLFCALFIVAGNWQANKAAAKQAVQDRLDTQGAAMPTLLDATPVKAEEYAQRSVVVSGVYEDRYSILVDNRIYQGRAGYFVYSPLRIGGSDTYVLINRGWAPQGRTREELPQVPAKTGIQNVAGIAVAPGTRFMQLQADEKPGVLWQNLDMEHYRQWSGLRLHPIVIEQLNDSGDGLVRDWPRPDVGIDKNRAYAMQWYSFFILAIALYVFFHVKRIRTA